MRRRVAVVAFSIVTSAASEPLSLRVLPQAHPGPVDFRLASVSGDGRFVAFVSEASLLPGDTNGTSDIYVFEMNSGRLELASVTDAGGAGSGSSSHPHLSRDGRFLVFDSVADNLAADAPSSCPTVYLRDRFAGTTRAIVRSSANPARIVCASRPAISGDGRVVAFESHATDLVDGIDANGNGADVYVVEIQAARTSRISVDKTGRQDAVGSSYGSSISADGRYVAFTSTACLDRNLPGRRRHAPAESCPAQVYARDRFAAVTRPVMAMNEAWPNGPAHSAALSADGRYVTFVSTATNLVPGPPSRTEQVYLHDLAGGSNELVSYTPHGTPGNDASSRPAVSGGGRFVVFQSIASDLVCRGRCPDEDRDYNLVSDIFLLDRRTGVISRVSRGPAREPWWAPSVGAALDASGRVVAFSSRHPMNSADTRADFNLFVVTR